MKHHSLQNHFSSSFKQKNEIYFEKGSYYKKSTLARAVSRVSHDFESQFECLPAAYRLTAWL